MSESTAPNLEILKRNEGEYLARILFWTFDDCIGPVVASADGPTQETVAPVNARYAVVQSSFAVRYTFKLDRYTGRTWQLLSDEKGSSVWQEITVLAIQRSANPQIPRFQLSLSGVGMRNAFLLDTVTGSTWVLLQIVSDTKDDGRQPGQLWVPVETSGSAYPDAPFLPAGAEAPKK